MQNFDRIKDPYEQRGLSGFLFGITKQHWSLSHEMASFSWLVG
jgi:hypothetical protein